VIQPSELALIKDFFAFVAVVTTMGCGTGIIITWIKRKDRKQVAGIPPILIGRLDDIADRLSRLDASVDTIAVEVERISEAQRFTARVLADRVPPAALPDALRQSGSKTPH
jgi:hypothetical protein